MKTKKMPICKQCKKELTENEMSYNWIFGKIWFCGNSCATTFAVEEVLKTLKQK